MNWRPLFAGEVEKRPVKLWIYEDGGQLKVETTQLGDVADATIALVISDGENIEVEATDANELVQELKAVGFSETAAREIARHGDLQLRVHDF